MRALGITDVGITRSNNEDYFAIVDALDLYVVADGMGGYQAGEVASELAVKAIVSSFENSDCNDFNSQIDEALSKANEAIMAHVTEHPNLRGMGTTVVVLKRIAETLYLANVGDSRCYGINESEITQLSKDHSLVAELVKIGSITQEEAEKHPDRNIITSALGVDRQFEVFKSHYDASDYKYILICSDGLTNMVESNVIHNIINSAPFDEVPKTLIDLANKNGGKDNITVICIEL